MALRKRALVVLIWTSTVLLAGAGAHGLWAIAALRDRPWQLEFHTDTLAGSCRIGPGELAFRPELASLDTQIDGAKKCLSAVDDGWLMSRDYSPCAKQFLDASLLAYRIRWNQEIRAAGIVRRLAVALKILESEIEANADAQTGTVRNYSQFQARTLLDSARNLAALGQTESALVATMKARASWAQSEIFVAAELARFYDDELRADWEKQAQDLLAWTGKNRRAAILVDKLEHRCLLLSGGRIEKSYPANLGRNWFRDKIQEQDASTPEGEYRITQKFSSTAFGLALLLNYPNADDLQRFNKLKKAGRIPAGARIGGGIEIHGGGRPKSDWTDGCVSLDNREMADLYGKSYVGMPVTIVGTCSLK
jgi:hypothetical protein